MAPKRRQSAGGAAAAAAAAAAAEGGGGGEMHTAYRHCFLQAMMARQYLKESDAKELYRQITGAANGGCSGWVGLHARGVAAAAAAHSVAIAAAGGCHQPSRLHPCCAFPSNRQMPATSTLWRT